MFTALLHTLGGTLFVSLLDLKRPVLLVLVAALASNDLVEDELAVLPHLGELESRVALVLKVFPISNGEVLKQFPLIDETISYK